MKKLLIAGVAVIATFAVLVPAAQANSDTCFNRSLDGERVACTTSTTSENPDEAIIRTGKRSAGVWTLLCADRWNHVVREQERIGRAARVVIPLDGFDECALRATVASRKRAVARVVLNEEENSHHEWPWHKR